MCKYIFEMEYTVSYPITLHITADSDDKAVSQAYEIAQYDLSNHMPAIFDAINVDLRSWEYDEENEEEEEITYEKVQRDSTSNL